MVFDILLSFEGLVALFTLAAMEIVLGIDNIIFLSILVSRLPIESRSKGRSLGIFLALFMRIGLLFSISWVMSLKDPLFEIFNKSFSGRDLILLGGGLFLIFKSTVEIHHKVENIEAHQQNNISTNQKSNFFWVMVQVVVLDIVFSLDSVITAVGMVQEVSIMVTAMVIAMIVMLFSAKYISEFVDNHPTVKILALSFLILIGVMLIVESMGGHVSKAYIYFAMFFSLSVELLNMRYRMKRPLIGLNKSTSD